jgi:phosphatidylserine decarboxylase
MERGAYMDSPASKVDIARFLKAFQGQVSIADIDGNIDDFRTFNEFFYRKLKPGTRSIASPEKSGVLVSCADCRLMAFSSVSDAQEFWIKVRESIDRHVHLGQRTQVGLLA